MTKLSDTQRVILSAAAQDEMGLARAPKTLPAAARNAVFRSLIKNNLLTEINAPRDKIGLGWRQDEDGTWIVARITDEGLRAIGIDPNEGQPGEPDASGIEGSVPDGDEEDERPRHEQNGVDEALIYGPDNGDEALLDETLARPRTTAPTKQTLRFAAARVIDAWDACPAQDATDNPITRAIDAMRALLDAPADEPATRRVKPTGQRALRETKHAQVLALLARDEGATGAQIAEATGWANNTVRGFLAGLKSKGHQVEVIDRVRQVGPNKTGAKGSYTVYRIAKEG